MVIFEGCSFGIEGMFTFEVWVSVPVTVAPMKHPTSAYPILCRLSVGDGGRRDYWVLVRLEDLQRTVLYGSRKRYQSIKGTLCKKHAGIICLTSNMRCNSKEGKGLGSFVGVGGGMLTSLNTDSLFGVAWFHARVRLFLETWSSIVYL